MSDLTVAEPLDRVENEIDQLDLLLNILNNDRSGFPMTIEQIEHDILNEKKVIDNKDFHLAIDKLYADKYVQVFEKSKGQNDAYRITYEGRLFLKSTWRIYNRRPYREGNFKNKLATVWTIIKVTSSAVITLIVVIIGILGLILTDKTDKLQQTIDDQTKTIETQIFKVDSLIKVTNDTTRLKKR